MAMVETSTSWIRSATLTAAGPIIVGAALGTALSGTRAPLEAVLLPGVIWGVTALMAPVLYIGASLLGVAPEARAVASAAIRGLQACGTVLCGLAAPMAFLLLTMQALPAVRVLGTLVVGAAALAALRVVYADLFGNRRGAGRVVPMFTVWAAVTLAIGYELFAGSLRA